MTGANASQDTAILFALPEESAPFLHRIRPEAHSLAVGVSGMGTRKAAQEARRLLEASGAARLIICGFAGGLRGEAPGTLVVARRVADYTAPDLPPRELSADARLCQTAEQVQKTTGWRTGGIAVQTGLLVTVPQVLASAAEKRQLAEETNALAVDMETVGAARVAQEWGIPWLAIRAITDGVNDTLPFDFDALTDAHGNPDRNKIILATLLQPWKIPALLRLGQRSTLAAGNLAHFLEAFLNALPE